MPDFSHVFYSASGIKIENTVNLPTRAVEDAGLLEILQNPGPKVGIWGLFDPLLDTTSTDFRFVEPLGQSREAKTALSGLFGRFVARAYATRELGFTHFAHVGRPPMRLSGPLRGELRRVKGQRGDMPDWIAWGPQVGMAIVEAKSCHEKKSPRKTLDRAFAQAERAEIWGGQKLAPFKRYAIATRWGFAAPLNWAPMLWVRDPEEKGDSLSPDEVDQLQAGVVRLHYASLLDRLDHKALAAALRDLARIPFRKQHDEARSRATTALENSSPLLVTGKLPVESHDELIGAFVTRSGAPPFDELSEADQRTLSRLKINPAYVGIERDVLKLAIAGDMSSLKNRKSASMENEHQGPADDGAGVWIVPLDEESPQIK